MFHAKKRHKFHAQPCEADGIKFPSKLERRYYQHLMLLKHAGEVVFFLRQVPFHLPGGVKYVADFQIFYADGTVSFVDVKGVETDTFKMKRKMVEALYPVEIQVIKKF